VIGQTRVKGVDIGVAGSIGRMEKALDKHLDELRAKRVANRRPRLARTFREMVNDGTVTNA